MNKGEEEEVEEEEVEEEGNTWRMLKRPHLRTFYSPIFTRFIQILHDSSRFFMILKILKILDDAISSYLFHNLFFEFLFIYLFICLLIN